MEGRYIADDAIKKDKELNFHLRLKSASKHTRHLNMQEDMCNLTIIILLSVQYTHIATKTSADYYCLQCVSRTRRHLFSLRLSFGGSVAGRGEGVLRVVLLWGANGAGRTETDGLPADVERTAGVCSTKFRPN